MEPSPEAVVAIRERLRALGFLLTEDAARDHGELVRDFGFRPRTLESGLAQLFGERRRISQGP